MVNPIETDASTISSPSSPGIDYASSAEIDDAFLANIVRSSVNPYLVLDAEGRILFITETISEITGYAPDECIGQPGLDFVVPKDHDLVATAIAQQRSQTTADKSWTGPAIPVHLIAKDGSIKACQMLGVGAPVTGFEGVVVRITHTESASKLDTAIAAMATSDHLDETLRLLADVLYSQLAGAYGCIFLSWNGHSFDETIQLGDAITGVLTPEAHQGTALPWRQCARSGTFQYTTIEDLPSEIADAAGDAGFVCCWSFPIPLSGNPSVLTLWRPYLGNPSTHHLHAVNRILRLMSVAWESHRARNALRRQAYTDMLTGLANRRGLIEYFEALPPITDEAIGFLYCDIDDFKVINDTYGHVVGDEVLQIVANRISAEVRSSDLVARIGGDEFTVVCRGADLEQMQLLAQRVLQTFLSPLHIDGRQLNASLSIGITSTTLRNRQLNADGLIRSADRALMAAKGAGKGMWRTASYP